MQAQKLDFADEAMNIILSNNHIDTSIFSCDVDYTDCTKNVQMKVNCPVRQEVYGALVALMIDKVNNMRDVLYAKAQEGMPADYAKNQKLCNIVRQKILVGMKKDSEYSVKNYSYFKFIDRLTSKNTFEYNREIRVVNNQPAIFFDIKQLCADHKGFADIYKTNPTGIENEVCNTLITAYNAALKLINSKADPLKKSMKKAAKQHNNRNRRR